MGIQLEKAIRFLKTKKYTFEELNKSDPKLKKQRDFILAGVEMDPNLLKTKKEYCDDDEIVRAAIKQDGALLAFASDRIKNDKQTAIYAIFTSLMSVKVLGENLKQDIKFLAALAVFERSLIYYLLPEIEKQVVEVLNMYEGNEEALVDEQLGLYDVPKKLYKNSYDYLIDDEDMEEDDENS